MTREVPAKRMVGRSMALLLSAAFFLASVGPLAGSVQAKAKDHDGLRVLGVLPNSIDSSSGNVVGFDQKRQLMYYMHRRGPLFYLGEYDLRPEVPKLLREEEMGTYAELGINYYSPYTIALDESRRLLVILVTHTHGTALKFIDLKSLDFIGQWDLASVLPGFVGQGMTFSESDGRIYLIGTEAGNAYGTFSFGVQKPTQPAMVLALNARLGPDEAPSLEWIKPVPQCQQIMDTTTVGALVARSENLPALYFACVRPDQYPGESGVVRVWIDSKADRQEALQFPVEFFPVSGSFSSATNGIIGISGFDPVRERLFVQSLSEATPGAWVLDGLKSAWIGLVAAPDNDNWFLGLDPKAGHYYMGGRRDDGYIVVSDSAATPISQGLVVEGIPVQGPIAVDPATHRLFVPVDVKRMGLWHGKEEFMRGVVVIRDETTIAKPAKPVDYDELTRDVPESPKVVTAFSAGVNGFGTRLLLIGGYGGILSATGKNLAVSQLRPGDRGLTAARVASLDLRRAGASAHAQALVPDANTQSEISDAGSGNVVWPWEPASCLNGGGDKVEAKSEGTGGGATVTCDIEGETASASSSWGTVSADVVSVSKSSFEARTWREADKGVITEATAVARGIEVAIPDGQTLSIARIWAHVTTVGHGRPGSTKAVYERRISGMEVTDAKGEVIQRIGGCGSKEDELCADAVRQINDALSLKLRIEIPKPVIEATKGGAFAGVQQSDGDFYQGRTMNNQGSTFSQEAASRAVPALQVTVFNDTEEKSRLVAQFAAIQANSIYTNTPLTVYKTPKLGDLPPLDDTSIDTSDAGFDLSGSVGDAPIGDVNVAPEADPVALPVSASPIEGTLAFLRRSPGEALLVAAVWLTFVSAGVSALRRRSFLSLLERSRP